MTTKRTRSEIVKKMESLKDVVIFQHQESDCGQTVIKVLVELDMYSQEDLQITGYRRSPDSKTLRDFLVANTERERTIGEAQPGDIFLMRWPSRELPSHVGFIGFNEILHCYGPARTVISEPLTEEVSERIMAVFVPKNIK